MDLAYFELLESKSEQLSEQLTDHILKVQQQMQKVRKKKVQSHHDKQSCNLDVCIHC